MSIPITLRINGRERKLEVKPNEILLTVLRDRLHLTGTKYGCGIGECGSCTILLNGKTVLSCQMLAVSAHNQEIVTIEGLGSDGTLDPIQESFLEEGAVQCGYCTPGMILTAKELLQRNPKPSSEAIQEAIRGNLCRCTGYTNIVRAIEKSAQKMEELKKQ